MDSLSLSTVNLCPLKCQVRPHRNVGQYILPIPKHKVPRLYAQRRSEDIDLSVLRFTLGIPGFDDSQLPPILGLLFGSLIVLNHILSPQDVLPSQCRSEIVGLILSGISVFLPTLRRMELNESSSRGGNLPTNLRQVFAMADWLSDAQKQELAWASYALLRNTRAIAILVWIGDEVILARGCWDLDEEGAAKSLSVLRDTFAFAALRQYMYLRNGADSQGLEFVPKGVSSLLSMPFTNEKGGLVVVSDTSRAYNDKDRTWIRYVAQKISSSI